MLENPAAGQFPENWPVVGPLGPSPESRFNLPARWKYRERANKWRKEIQSHSVFHTSYFRQCPIPGIPSVVVVHDMVYELMPYHLYGDIEAHIEFKKHSFEKADVIIAISDSTKQDLLTLYPHLKSKVVTISHGADHFWTSTEASLEFSAKFNDKPYALFVGDRGGYKNFHALLHALLDSEWPSDLPLRVVGSPFSETEQRFLHRMGIDGVVKNLGQISNSELEATYLGASVFVFPSLFEGFGFPLLEAQARGVPTAASGIPIFHEVGGLGFQPFDPRDPSSIAKAVAHCLEDGNAMQLNSLAKENVLRFRWDDTAKKTVEIWRSLARG